MITIKSKKGQTLVEYALILTFIAIVAISVLIALGHQVASVKKDMAAGGNPSFAHNENNHINGHHWRIVVEGVTYNCNSAPILNMDNDTVIKPVGWPDVVLHHNATYTQQEFNE